MGALICLLAVDTFLTGLLLAHNRHVNKHVNHYTALCDEFLETLIEIDEKIKAGHGSDEQ